MNKQNRYALVYGIWIFFIIFIGCFDYCLIPEILTYKQMIFPLLGLISVCLTWTIFILFHVNKYDYSRPLACTIIFICVFCGLLASITETKIINKEIQNFSLVKSKYNTIIDAKDYHIIDDNISLYKTEKENIKVYLQTTFNSYNLQISKDLKYKIIE